MSDKKEISLHKVTISIGFCILWITNTVVSGYNPVYSAIVGVFLLMAPPVYISWMAVQNNL